MVAIDTGLKFVRDQATALAQQREETGDGAERPAAGTTGSSSSGSQQQQQVVFVDVDAKDNTTGIMFPPQSFLTVDFLEMLYSVLDPAGA